MLITVGGGWAVIRALRIRALASSSSFHSRATRRGAPHPRCRGLPCTQCSPRHTAHDVAWCQLDARACPESMLAAQIIQVSISSSGQSELSWWRMSLIVIIALSRILM